MHSYSRTELHVRFSDLGIISTLIKHIKFKHTANIHSNVICACQEQKICRLSESLGETDEDPAAETPDHPRLICLTLSVLRNPLDFIVKSYPP